MKRRTHSHLPERESRNSRASLVGWSGLKPGFLALMALFCFLVPISLSEGSLQPPIPKPLNIIFDTDMRSDCDDAGALAMLHAMADRGECHILGVIATTTGPDVVGAIDAINTYYGRPETPVGLVEGTHDYSHDDYASTLADRGRFPSRRTNATAPTSSALYRQLLNSVPDKSVKISVVGAQTALLQLLETKADHEGDGIQKSGHQLVSEKVSELVIMGGHFANPDLREHNIFLDVAAAQRVANDWPTPVVYSGYEVGERVRTGNALNVFLPEENPVAMAYFLYRGTDGGVGSIGNRESWDLVATYYAVRGLNHKGRDLWTLSEPMKVSFDDAAKASYAVTPDGNHRIMIEQVPPNVPAAIFDELMIRLPKAACSK